MIVETVRVSKRARDQLITIKRNTKIENWNVVCRWALMESLKEPTVPSKEITTPDSNIEMTWRTFTGPNDEIIAALIRERCLTDGIEPTQENLVEQFKLHLHRGIRYLAADRQMNSIAELVSRSTTCASRPRHD